MEDPASYYGGQLKEIVFENTYITDPAGYGARARFRAGEVQAAVQAAPNVLAFRVANVSCQWIVSKTPLRRAS